tara:strand:+ start:610 stop:1017 length:408 start_codon:yes stop_codon:yes gene_type:complete
MSIAITNIRNALSTNDDNTEFELEIEHPEYGWIPYALNSHDTDNTINNSDLMTLIGTNFTARTQEDKDEEATNIARDKRDTLLQTEVDPLVTNPLRWAELTTEQQNAWTQYRTDLLNVPQQSGFPHSVTFPTKPS